MMAPGPSFQRTAGVAMHLEPTVIFAIAGALAWALWRSSRPRPVFAVRIVAGQPAAVDGTVTSAFLVRLRELAAAHQLLEAEVAGFAHDGVIRLHFSRDVPDAARQQLRNWWAMHGWNAPRQLPSRRCG
jgi:hypothetical protein